MILSVTDLEKTFQVGNGENEVLHNFNLSVCENEFLCILGPSGCGKTTLLRCIAGFEEYSGTILCKGKRVEKPAPDRIMVFQDYNQLFPWKTVGQNIEYPLKIKGIRDRKKRSEIRERFLSMVGLAGYQAYYPHELSGGMKQRVAIAKALAQEPDLILMDEPFAALDAITRNGLQRELCQISGNTNTTFIFVTHNIQEALTLGTRVLLMGKNGRIVMDETNPLKKPVTPSTEGYGKMWDLFSSALAEEMKELGPS